MSSQHYKIDNVSSWSWDLSLYFLGPWALSWDVFSHLEGFLCKFLLYKRYLCSGAKHSPLSSDAWWPSGSKSQEARLDCNGTSTIEVFLIFYFTGSQIRKWCSKEIFIVVMCVSSWIWDLSLYFLGPWALSWDVLSQLEGFLCQLLLYKGYPCSGAKHSALSSDAWWPSG